MFKSFVSKKNTETLITKHNLTFYTLDSYFYMLQRNCIFGSVNECVHFLPL